MERGYFSGIGKLARIGVAGLGLAIGAAFPAYAVNCGVSDLEKEYLQEVSNGKPLDYWIQEEAIRNCMDTTTRKGIKPFYRETLPKLEENAEDKKDSDFVPTELKVD